MKACVRCKGTMKPIERWELEKIKGWQHQSEGPQGKTEFLLCEKCGRWESKYTPPPEPKKSALVKLTAVEAAS